MIIKLISLARMYVSNYIFEYKLKAQITKFHNQQDFLHAATLHNLSLVR